MGADPDMYRLTFRILETLDEHFYAPIFEYHWSYSGFGLEDPVLKKLYRTNALEVARRAAENAPGAGRAGEVVSMSDVAGGRRPDGEHGRRQGGQLPQGRAASPGKRPRGAPSPRLPRVLPHRLLVPPPPHRAAARGARRARPRRAELRAAPRPGRRHRITVGAGLSRPPGAASSTTPTSWPCPTGGSSATASSTPSSTPRSTPGASTRSSTPRTAVRAGLLICYDNNIVENVRIAALRGAEVLLAPHQTGGCRTTNPHLMGLIDRRLWDERHAEPGGDRAGAAGRQRPGLAHALAAEPRPRQRPLPRLQQRRGRRRRRGPDRQRHDPRPLRPHPGRDLEGGRRHGRRRPRRLAPREGHRPPLDAGAPARPSTASSRSPPAASGTPTSSSSRSRCQEAFWTRRRSATCGSPGCCSARTPSAASRTRASIATSGWSTTTRVARIKETLFEAERLGITGLVARTDFHVMRMLLEYRDDGGKLHWLAQTCPEVGDSEACVRRAARGGRRRVPRPRGRHGPPGGAGPGRRGGGRDRAHPLPGDEGGDRRPRARGLRVGREAPRRRLLHVLLLQPDPAHGRPGARPRRRRGVPRGGPAGHDRPHPDALAAGIHYKILAAGRNDPEEAFASCAARMRPQDLACVGVFTGDDPRMLETDVRLFEKHSRARREATAGVADAAPAVAR